jgi:hypothetical protein
LTPRLTRGRRHVAAPPRGRRSWNRPASGGY